MCRISHRTRLGGVLLGDDVRSLPRNLYRNHPHRNTPCPHRTHHNYRTPRNFPIVVQQIAWLCPLQSPPRRLIIIKTKDLVGDHFGTLRFLLKETHHQLIQVPHLQIHPQRRERPLVGEEQLGPQSMQPVRQTGSRFYSCWFLTFGVFDCLYYRSL